MLFWKTNCLNTLGRISSLSWKHPSSHIRRNIFSNSAQFCRIKYLKYVIALFHRRTYFPVHNTTMGLQWTRREGKSIIHDYQMV